MQSGSFLSVILHSRGEVVLHKNKKINTREAESLHFAVGLMFFSFITSCCFLHRSAVRQWTSELQWTKGHFCTVMCEQTRCLCLCVCCVTSSDCWGLWTFWAVTTKSDCARHESSQAGGQVLTSRTAQWKNTVRGTEQNTDDKPPQEDPLLLLLYFNWTLEGEQSN